MSFPKLKLFVAFAYVLGLLGLTVARCNAQEPALSSGLDVVYGEVAGKKLTLDVFRLKDSPDPHPVVMFIHGGGWAAGDKNDFRTIARRVAQAGFVSVCVNYRLVTNGANLYPAALDDVQRSVRWIQDNAAKYRANPKKIGAMGASAGGHLVALLGTVDTRDNSDTALAKYPSRVTCVVDMCGPVDLTSDFSTNVFGTLSVQKIIDDFIGKPMKDAPALFREASPLYHIDQKTAPFLIVHGDADTLVPIDQSRRLDAALKKAGIESKLITFEGEGHLLARRENGENFIKESIEFFKRHLAP